MTEEEARTRWCPMAANSKVGMILAATIPVVSQSIKIVNTAIDQASKAVPDNLEKCIASDCAMWVETRSQKEADAYNDMSQIGTKLQQPSGHCGLIK